MKMRRQKAYIHQSELTKLSAYTMDYPNCETGGELFGTYTTAGNPIVQYVTGPGAKAYRSGSFFRQDPHFLEAVGQVLNAHFAIQHIGTWHSHHQLGLSSPSSHDSNTMASAVQEYQLPKFTLIIATIEKGKPLINGFVYNLNQDARYDEIEWCVLTTDSPFRQYFDSNYSHLVAPTNQIEVELPTLKVVSNTIEAIAEAVEFSVSSWISSKEGKKVLAMIYKTLSENFQDIKTFQDNDGEVYFSLPIDDSIFKIKFPPSFPKYPPIIFQELYGVRKRLTKLPKWNTNFKNTDKEVLRYLNTTFNLIYNQTSQSYGSETLNQGSS